MDVRQVRPTDAPLVLSLALDLDSQLIRRSQWPSTRGLVQTMIRSGLPLPFPGKTWVCQGETGCGILEAEPRQYVIGWDITLLAVRGDREDVLPSLLQAVTAFLQSKGVPRLFARCGVEESGILEKFDFRPLAREYILMSAKNDIRGDPPLPIDSRYRMPQDAWPLHQLESEVTPFLVRQLEGSSSSDWSNKPKNMSEIVVEREGRLVGWIAWGTKRREDVNTIRMLVHADHKELGRELLHHALQTVPPGTRFVSRVRDYQSETLSTFLEAGFQMVAEEILTVKHAQVEFAKASNRILRAARVPVMPGLHSNLRALPATRTEITRKIEVQDRNT